MALSVVIWCHRCGEHCEVWESSGGSPRRFCDDCQKKLDEEAWLEHLKKLRQLTPDERLERIERRLYEQELHPRTGWSDLPRL
ncbi:MAG: hypothetical protein COV08_02225 [Candidatus Vogelbacteria bacterium CG10_big_fil_rev_8_21_14_0_10_49_38]|uniref:Uncharacterized protein n=1 Tax=Candidatus Vogelbacteria bacterium CG10_big_fil_rev_8_21_14_0_10_49_38 TaxID=1975043 RepID=A0A2H0RHM6_9BACT|nr:MAG: hypothetical protein BK006_02245 [bacterium CG10_49_38]PIR45957.1 MAG: hypothetical protein COV08_02225 [Candidatus Vogelbacteria bacterium CG10_big_fil_rev_8_21_14_0_10_49_38]